MDSNAYRTVDINLKDLFFVIVKRLGAMILIGVIFALPMFIYGMVSSTREASTLDASTKMEGESDAGYENRVQTINRAKDTISSIDALNAQIDSQRDYMAKSILMQIDVKHEAVTTVHVVVSVDENQANGMTETLASAYAQDIMSGEYLSEVANDLGTEQAYVTELISVKYGEDNDSVTVSAENPNGNTITIAISVVGPDIELTDRVMDCILDEIDSAYAEFNSSISVHAITIVGQQSFYKIDDYTRDVQYIAANRFEVLQKQIETLNEVLDSVASDLGVSNRGVLYSYFSYGSDLSNKPTSSISVAIKFSIIGFIAGVALVIIVIVLGYVFGKRFATQGKFFGKFPGLYKIGVLKPTNKRSLLTAFLDKKAGDDTELTFEKNNMLISANIKNLTSGMDKVLFTGTAETVKITELVSGLGIKADVKESIFVNPECLASISEYDGVIIVEQRKYSNCKLVAEEIEYISNADTKLIGAIVI